MQLLDYDLNFSILEIVDGKYLKQKYLTHIEGSLKAVSRKKSRLSLAIRNRKITARRLPLADS